MYFNRVYSCSTERIITRSPSTGTFDIELENPQPRRRQTFDLGPQNDHGNDQYETYAYAIQPKQEIFAPPDPDYLSLKNSAVKVPTNLPNVSTSNPLGTAPPMPEIVEEM
jgi:hypothetical protein